MILEGKAHKYGRDVDTDVIIPARYLNVSDTVELAKHCMEGLDADFVKKVKKGDMIVAEENFGCGSSREHAPLAIKASGISCIIAKSFARIFYRNSINIGLPILESAEAVDNIKDGDALRVDLSSGIIYNLSTGQSFQSQPFPEFMQKIVEQGGLIEYVKAKLGAVKP
jgi:3-isopropylmalate/(R)-2-methylmalate dehydratase small subunit